MKQEAGKAMLPLQNKPLQSTELQCTGEITPGKTNHVFAIHSIWSVFIFYSLPLYRITNSGGC